MGEPKLISSLLEKRRGDEDSLLRLVEELNGAVGIAEELIREVQLLQYLVDGVSRSRCLKPPTMDAAGSSGTFHPFGGDTKSKSTRSGSDGQAVVSSLSCCDLWDRSHYSQLPFVLASVREPTRRPGKAFVLALAASTFSRTRRSFFRGFR